MDPFHTAANQATSIVRGLDDALEALKIEISRSNCPCNLSSSLEFDKRGREVEEDLRLLKEAIDITENDRQRFGISDNELNRRRKIVENIGENLTKLQQSKTFVITQARRNCPIDGREKSLFVFDGNAYPSHEKFNREMIAKQQDERLAEIARNSSRLAGVAHSMNTELISQNILIDDLQHNVEGQLGTVDSVIKRVGSVLRTNSRRQVKQVLYLFGLFLILVVFLVVI